jgi:guanylate kinase
MAEKDGIHELMAKINPFNPLQPEPLLIVISGPSGVGKDSVLARMKERQLPFYFVVTATTRQRRPNETEGKDYFFVSHDQFAQMIESDELIEYAYVYNDYKGIPKSQVRRALESGRDVVMRLDVQGAASIRKLYPEALLIFLTTQNEEELVNRLKTRRTESHEELNLRIAMARQELKRIDAFDYILVNREYLLDDTVDMILSIIQAEHHRVHPRRVRLD